MSLFDNTGSGVPSQADTLLLIHPTDLSATHVRSTAYTIDQNSAGVSHVGVVSEFSNGDFVYFTVHIESPPTNQFGDIDATINLGTGVTSTDVFLYNDIQSALIADSVGDRVFLRDGGISLPGETAISVGDNPISLFVDETANLAYAVNRGDHTLTTINLNDNSTTSSHTGIGLNPLDIALDTTSGFALVVNGGDNTVSILDVGD